MRRFIIILSLLLSLPLSAQVATVVESAAEFECTGANSAVYRKHETIRVNSEHGASYAMFAVYCSDGISLSSFSGQIVDANGKVIYKLKQKDLVRSEYSSELKTDTYVYYFGYEAHSYPYTITYDWEQKFTNGFCSCPKFCPRPGFEADVLSASYKLISTDQNKFRFKALNFTPDFKESTDAKGRKVTEISMKDLPALPRLSYGLPFDQQSPFLYVVPTSGKMKGTICDMSDWQSLGLWEMDLRKGRDVIPEALGVQLKAMTDTCRTDRDKVRVVRQFMGNTTRYISIQEGISGYQTMSAEEVYKKGMGDCKALTNYLCSMLHYLGIPADYALISTKDKRLIEYPNFQQLNHVVAHVPLPGDTLWIECTNPKYPVGHFPADLSDHDVLFVTEKGGILSRTPALADEASVDNSHYDITLNAKGDADVMFNEWVQGHIYDHYLGLMSMSPTDQKKAMLSVLDLPKPSLSDLNIGIEGDSLHINVGLKSENYGKVTGKRLFIPLSPSPLSGLRNSKEPAHVISLEDNGFVATDTIMIHLPEGSQIEHLPESSVTEASFGTYSIHSESVGDNQIRVTSSLRYRSGIYPAEEYDKWVAWRKGIANMANAKIVILLP